jgi:exosome complex exonuclease RRP6
MLFYARADTHYLLYIYDNMRNELVTKSHALVPEESKMELTLMRSKEVSLLRYERQIYQAESGRGPGGWYPLLVKTPALFNNKEFAVFKAVHEWRDQVARIDDDSTNFVMPNRVIFSIAKVLPNDLVALLSVAHPVSFSVKSRAGELLEVIKKARAEGKDGPSMMDILRPDYFGTVAKANIPALAPKAKFPSEPMVAIVDEGELRSENSIFWGNAFGSSIWDEDSLDKAQDLRLAVPLPKFILEDTGTSNGFESSVPTFNSAPTLPESSTLPTKRVEEPFVLKRGSKRKSEAVEELEEEEKGEGSGEYDISLNDLEDQEAGEDGLTQKQRKGRRRAEKRAKKEAKAAAKAADAADLGEDEEEQPFDYGKAEPVLNSKRTDERGVGKGKGNKGQQTPFDPYSKSGDAPKGMRRAQTERAGKSHTFRS